MVPFKARAGRPRTLSTPRTAIVLVREWGMVSERAGSGGVVRLSITVAG